ncbi:MAG: hypothetical protein U0350_01415 [Caldilineaceae bacterium]
MLKTINSPSVTPQQEAHGVTARKTIRWLRISYWVGALFDAFVLLPMLSTKVAQVAFGIPNFNPGPDFRYAIYLAASLMLGWVCLLIWADRKPLERKGVLLLTVIPVLAGIIVAGVYAVAAGFISVGKMLPVWIMQGILLILFGFSYMQATRVKASVV